MKLNKFNKKLIQEYENNFNESKPKYRFHFKMRYALLTLIVMFSAFLLIDHVLVNNHNKKVTHNLYGIDISLTKIKDKKEVEEIIEKNKLKQSIYSSMFDNFAKNDVEMDSAENTFTGNGEPGMVEPAPDSPNASDQTNTNVQVNGIDEGDWSKCDGKYIYSIYENNLYIFNLDGVKIVSERIKFRPTSLFVSGSNIIVLGYRYTCIYHFEDNKVTILEEFEYRSYNDSRLTNDFFYLIYNNNYDKDDTLYESDTYYDGVSRIGAIYTIMRFNLKTHEVKKVNNINSGYVQLYMSQNNIYLATQFNSYFTIVSIFDIDLNPVAALKVDGAILNQFSMDEYDNHFRIVTTNRNAEDEKLNAISIFNLKTNELVGYLNEGIGIGRQIVKSVRFKDTTCYIVTYENRDPLYEIDLSDPKNPTIISKYQSPGYSSYLHTFTVDETEYLFGIGYCDDMHTRKISVYKNGEETVQVGRDLLICDYDYTSDDNRIKVSIINHNALNDHKALFIYQHEGILYLGVKVSLKQYTFFKIDVNAVEVITEYESITFEESYYFSRCYLINNKIYITTGSSLYIK